VSEETTRLVLVRHGESRAQVERVVGGEKGCTGLSDLGRRQVGALAERWALSGEVRADVLLASVLPRAVETAELLAPAVGDPSDIPTDCDLCELHPGEADGMTWDDYLTTYHPRGYDPDPERALAPGGESWLAFVARVDRALQRLVAEYAGHTVVVACHGGVIVSSLVSLMGLPALEGPPGTPGTRPVRFNPVNASVTVWERHESEFGAPWRLVRYNDVAHLEGLAGP
jgi:2,3-bisphosphoglycerate-dependent phosphoglycerate mutase